MKHLLHYINIVAAVVLLASCNDNKQVDEPTPSEPATLDITDTLVQAKATGGSYTICYTLENGVGAELQAEAAAEWIHSFDYSIEGEVTFTVDANPTSESRIANLYLRYGKAEDKVVVSQTGISPDDIVYEFNITYDIDGPYVDMTVEAKPEGVRYFAWYYPKETLDEALAQSPGVDIVKYLNRWVEVDLSDAIYYGAYAGYTPEQAVAEITFVGKSTQSFELNGETDFYGFACAVTDGGTRLSDVTVTEFRTGTVAASDNNIEVIVNDINSDRFDYTIQTSNDDQYAAIVFPAEEVESMTDAEFIAMFNDIGNYIPYLHRNNYSTTALVGKDDADYYIIAFGFEYGMATTAIQRVKVHTLKSDPTLIPEFEFSVDKVTNFRIKATVDTSHKTCLYYADYCYDGETAEELMAMVREAADWYVNNGYYPSLAACMKAIGVKGRKSFDFNPLAPETDYRLFAIGIDETTGEFNTEVIFTEVIRTPAKQVSESYIEIPIGKYFDGFDLIEAYPEEFADADGWAVIPLEVTTHGDVVDYYYDVYLGDVTDTTYPTDDEIILDLEMYGIHNDPLSMSYCYFNEPLTLIYFSKDGDDNFSPVKRVLFTMTPDDCSPIEEFEYGAELSSMVYKQSRKL